MVGERVAQYRIGIYSLDGLRCRGVVSSRWPVNTVQIHPTLPLAAVGTGCYDGGYAFEGELLMLDLGAGRCSSVLQYAREIRAVEWAGPSTLDVVAAPYDDHEDDEAHTHGYAFSLECDDWTTVPDRAFTPLQQSGPRVPLARPRDGAAAEQVLTDLCAEHGLPSWELRRHVWAVEPHGDGSVLAASEGVEAESWLPDGSFAWVLPDAVGGRQVHLAPDGQSAWVTVPGERVFADRRWQDLPARVDRIRLEDGRLLETLGFEGPVMVAASRDGRLAIRDTDRLRGASRSSEVTRLIDTDGDLREVGRVALGGYDVFNHYFAVRRSPSPLFLRGNTPEHHLDKDLVAVDIPEDADGPVVRVLFPLEWDAQRHGHLFGGPGTWIEDSLGTAVVHAGTVHDGAGLLPGNAFVVRRALPHGDPAWVFTADSAPTALDTDGITVYVTFADSSLVALDARTGEPRWRQRVIVDDVALVALSLAVVGPGRIFLGMWDGRILDCAVPVDTPRFLTATATRAALHS
ncbi:PQQ-binding-like beta-propeller repeat protein [Streptacidiphilus sp. PAMC 29251]